MPGHRCTDSGNQARLEIALAAANSRSVEPGENLQEGASGWQANPGEEVGSWPGRGSPAALHGFEITARRRLSVGFSSSSFLSFGPRDVQLWIYCRGACSSSRLFAAAAASSSSSSAAAATNSSFPTLFGDGYSWVDNTDYVVIA
ncbi:uncharacterized protein PHA67_013667 isoform 1-T1 [Liasis olivaceus]